jgi:hypothetical protein
VLAAQAMAPVALLSSHRRGLGVGPGLPGPQTGDIGCPGKWRPLGEGVKVHQLPGRIALQGACQRQPNPLINTA